MAVAGRLLYYAFDLLYLNGFSLLDAAIEDRRGLLERLLAGSPRDGRLHFSADFSGAGATFLESACKLGLEGVVSKRAGTRYRAGVRGGEWQKSKCLREQEFVIGGFTDPAGSRLGFGALLLGVYEEATLRYVGKVGTGFTEEILDRLDAQLRCIEIDRAPFTDGLERAPKAAHWVKPELVAEVAFAEWTQVGDIRHPSFKGLRKDKPVSEVVREEGDVVSEAARSREQENQVARGTSGEGREGPRAPHAMEGVTLTHPDRVFWPIDQVTKRDLVDYYDMVSEWMLPYVLRRPLASVRCPDGVAPAGSSQAVAGARRRDCFFHKHAGPDFPGPFERIVIGESGGPGTYLAITEAGSLAGLAQMGVLEIHTWGSTWPDIERPDVLVFDLDPDPAIEWSALARGARLMRDVLLAVGLESFVKSTGGKGLHVVAPITPSEDWEIARTFGKAMAQTMVDVAPDTYTATMSKSKREGKIYIDYLRNARGATSIAPYSTRAREQATVAVPLRWSELKGAPPKAHTLTTLKNRLSRLAGDPWDGYFEVQRSQTLTAAVKRASGSR